MLKRLVLAGLVNLALAWGAFAQVQSPAPAKSPSFNVTAFGGVCDGKIIYGGASMTNGSPVLSISGYSFSAADIGATIDVSVPTFNTHSASAIPAINATILSVSGGNATLNTNWSGTSTSAAGVRWYHTVDTQAIQAAINAASLALPSGGWVQFPEGVCVTGALTLPSNVRIVGTSNGSSVLLLANGTNANMFTGTNFASLVGNNGTGGIKNFAFQDIQLDGNRGGNVGSGIGTPSSSGSAIKVYGYEFSTHNLLINNFAADGIYTEWSSSAGSPIDSNGNIGPDGMEAHVDEVKCAYGAGWCIVWNGPHDSVLSNITTLSMGTGGILNYSAANGSPISLYFYHGYQEPTDLVLETGETCIRCFSEDTSILYDYYHTILGSLFNTLQLGQTGGFPVYNLDIVNTSVTTLNNQTGSGFQDQWANSIIGTMTGTSYVPYGAINNRGLANTLNSSLQFINGASYPAIFAQSSASIFTFNNFGTVQWTNNGSSNVFANSISAPLFIGSVTPTLGGTTRTLANLFSDSYNVKNYGAVLNGTTNDSAAFQAAYNAAPSGGTINIPNGNLNATITPSSNKSVLWNLEGTFDFSTNSPGTAPVNLFGDGDVLAGFFAGRYNFTKAITNSTNGYAVVDINIANNSGSQIGQTVISGLTVESSSSSTAHGYTWGIVSSQTSGANGGTNNQDVGVASYINKNGASDSFQFAGGTTDRTGGNTGNIIAFESDIVSNGPEAASTSYNPIGGARQFLQLSALSYIPPVWTANTAIALGYIVQPTVSNGFVYKATVAGTTSSFQPTWPTSAGTVIDGGVTWTFGTTVADQVSRGIMIGGGDTTSQIGAGILFLGPYYDAAIDMATATLVGSTPAAIRLGPDMPIDFSATGTAISQNVRTLRYQSSGSVFIYQNNGTHLLEIADSGSFGMNTPANGSIGLTIGGTKSVGLDLSGGIFSTPIRLATNQLIALEATGTATFGFNGAGVITKYGSTTLEFVNGTGDMQVSDITSIGTQFTTSGCSISSPLGGASAGKMTSGVSGTCTVTVTLAGATGVTGKNGWSCWINDLTTPTNVLHQTSSTTTNFTFSGTTTSGDVLNFGCMGY